MNVLNCGSCEPVKISVHGAALGLAVVMGLYNAAAWLRRRERHLAVNAVLYGMLTAWEQKHVAHHFAEIRRQRQAAAAPEVVTAAPVLTDLAA